MIEAFNTTAKEHFQNQKQKDYIFNQENVLEFEPSIQSDQTRYKIFNKVSQTTEKENDDESQQLLLEDSKLLLKSSLFFSKILIDVETRLANYLKENDYENIEKILKQLDDY